MVLIQIRSLTQLLTTYFEGCMACKALLVLCTIGSDTERVEKSSSRIRGHFSIVTQLENDEANLFHAGRDTPL